MKYSLIVLAASALLLSSCAEKLSSDRYDSSELGVSRAVEFGTILNVREVNVTRTAQGAGALGGGAVGAGVGSYGGGGSGSNWATAGGAILGAVIGNEIDKELRNTKGNEYVLQMLDGDVKTIVLEKTEENVVFKAGDKVMLQYCDAGEYARKCKAGGQYQRLIPVQKFPKLVRKNGKKLKPMDVEVYVDEEIDERSGR